MSQVITEIPPYKYVKSKVNGFNFYYYLHIRGGAGNWLQKKHRNGGEYDFIVFYASPQQMGKCNICERIWCEENEIPCGEGSTIEEAYQDFLIKEAEFPLK